MTNFSKTKNKKKHNKRNRICGDLCPDCLYICEGDYLCDSDKFDEPAIVLTEFSSPTTDYLRCRKNIAGKKGERR